VKLTDIRNLAEDIARAKSAVAFSGAALSTTSGIPDFRSEDGLWQEYDPESFSIHSLRRNPEEFWSQYRELHESIMEGTEVRPNQAHHALADMVNNEHLDAIITQNVDDLQEAAGTTKSDLFKLHGDAGRVVCMNCDRDYEVNEETFRLSSTDIPPECEDCGGILKPGTILFGERLPVQTLEEAQQHAQQSEVFLVVGSSLTVEPAASLPDIALRSGTTLAIVNLQTTGMEDRADYVFQEDVTEVLPRLNEHLPPSNGGDY